jgi:hypothetical protein
VLGDRHDLTAIDERRQTILGVEHAHGLHDSSLPFWLDFGNYSSGMAGMKSPLPMPQRSRQT